VLICSLAGVSQANLSLGLHISRRTVRTHLDRAMRIYDQEAPPSPTISTG
jgi:DNA-binding CsgD family transcriptional regulator